MSAARRKEPTVNVKRTVLAEAGYRCGNPTCRQILALDIHHVVEVAEGGSNEPHNLLALCPTCHALYHRGEVTRDAIHCWKGIVVDLNHAFDKQSIDNLLFLDKQGGKFEGLSADGVVSFAGLIAAGMVKTVLAWKGLQGRAVPAYSYWVELTDKGKHLVKAWAASDRGAVREALAQPLTAPLPE